MDDADVSTFTLRNPLFSKKEICTLIDLIEEHKAVLLDKATNTAACFAKESAWTDISDSFNSQEFSFKRSTESLKLKWDNIKKSTRRKAKEPTMCNVDPVCNRVAKLLGESNLLHNAKSNRSEENHMDVEGIEQQSSFIKSLRNTISKDSFFTPSECDRLLTCVKAEKQHIFTRKMTPKSLELKKQAWDRIAAAFNTNRLQARSAKCLRKKFESMKKLSKFTLQSQSQSNFKSQANNCNDLTDESTTSYDRLFKLENTESDISYDGDGVTDDHTSNTDNFLLATLHDDDSIIHPNAVPEAACDPLSNALNGFEEPGDNDQKRDMQKLLRLKLELTKYKLEMAKECRLQKKEAHEALVASIAARTKLTELENKRTEFEIAALIAERSKSEQKNDVR